MIPKFRVWDKKKKRWILCGDEPYLQKISPMGEWIEYEEDGEIYTLYVPEEAIIQMFTDEPDINNEELCEGDIVRVIDDKSDLFNCVYHIIYGVGIHDIIGFHLCNISSTDIWDNEIINDEALCKDDGNTLEKIGNIMENPELLKEK